MAVCICPAFNIMYRNTCPVAIKSCRLEQMKIGYYYDVELNPFLQRLDRDDLPINYALIAHLSFAERARLLVLHSSAEGRIGPVAISWYIPSRKNRWKDFFTRRSSPE